MIVESVTCTTMPAGVLTKWQRLALELGEAIAVSRLHPKVCAWLDTNQRERLGVAFSGGADSLALLLLLWAHRPAGRKRLFALHFNHRLRGADSRADQRFCAQVCRSLGVPLLTGQWLKAPLDASEANARAARHAFFIAQLQRLRAHALCLGHHQDDVAETFLMRLSRGSGTAGLAAPRPVQAMPAGRVHLRPLLTLSKAEILEALRTAGVAWREDASNQGSRFFRNRVRSEVLPAWMKSVADRNALAGAALSRELLEEDDVALEVWADRLGAIRKDGSMNLRRLRGVPRAVIRRTLHRWLGAQMRGRGWSRQAFSALLQDVENGRATRHSVGSDGFAVITKTTLKMVMPSRKNSG